MINIMDNTIDFKLPIYYIESKNKLDDTIIDDLELIKSKDISGISLYDDLLQTDNFIGNKTAHMWSNYYSHDKIFLENTQDLIQNFKTFDCDENCLKNCLTNWEMIHNDDVFLDRYQYIDLPYVRKYNNSTTVLHFYSMYNLSSPVISLISPIFALIIPFFILKLKGVPITIQGYQDVLINMMKNSTIGKLFTDFTHRRWDQQLSLLVSAGLYIFGIYQNIIACYKFYININKITDTFKNIKNFIEYTNQRINDYILVSNKLDKYQKFNEKLIDHQVKLNKFYNKLTTVNIECITVYKIKQIGCIMKYFYDLKYNIDVISSINYMFYFHGYLDNIQSLKNKVDKHIIKHSRSEWTFNFKKENFNNFSKTDALNLYTKNMFRLSRLLKQNSISLSVAVYPWPGTLYFDQRDNWQVKIWQKFCQTECKNFYNLMNIFYDKLEKNEFYNVYNDYFIFGDIHFNEKGNRLIADTFLKKFLDNKK